MSDDDPRDIPLEGLLATFREALLRGVFTSIPGRVASYDSDKQRASVDLAIKRAHADDSSERVVEQLPQVHDVPIMFLGASRGRMTTPVQPGDECLVFFASSSVARWKKIGGIPDPGDDRMHDINDAFALVVDFRGGTPAPTDAVVIHGPVKLGGPTGTEKTIKAATWEDKFGDVIAAIASACGPGGGAVTTAWNAFKLTAYKTDDTEVK